MFTIRRATISDLGLARDALISINERSPCDEAAIELFLRDPSCYLLLALEGERVVGTLNGYALRRPYRREPQFFLYEIDVDAEWRGKGIGTALVDAFVHEARNAGAFEVWVLTDRRNTAAMKIYERSGLSEEDAHAQTVMMNWVIR